MAVTQASLLEGVSRTFALTIPQLPESLCPVVANGYLLCRIIDTIEDEPALHPEEKSHFCDAFRKVTAGELPAQHFSSALYPHLSSATLPAEHELIKHTPAVIETLFSFNNNQREALVHCIKAMSKGMAGFQQRASTSGLVNLESLNHYCYYVAGIVGEMLTRLFCDYSPAIAEHRNRLDALSVSFGQGLQMTNILKDVWEDLERGSCWLPQDIFNDAGFDLDDLSPGVYSEAFDNGLTRLIGISSQHLANAMHYTLLIPKQETGIRNFCLWAIGMAVLTLRKINSHRNFSSSQEVKISRSSVRAVVVSSQFAASHDRVLSALFHISQMGQPGKANLKQTSAENIIDLSSLRPNDSEAQFKLPANGRPA